MWLVMVAFVMASAAVACFLRVRVGDVAVAAVLGLATGLIAVFTSASATWRPVTEPVAALVVTTLALATDIVAHSGTGYATSLAGLVVLLPGLTFTVALTELSTRHLASGTARLSGTLVVFLGLGFGVALGAKFGTAIGLELRDLLAVTRLGWLSRAPLPRWAEWIALVVAPLAFTVLLNAAARDAGWIVLACVAAYLTSRFAGASMGEELGAFLGAFVVSAGSNLAARYFRRSSMVTQVPGLLILVPGSHRLSQHDVAARPGGRGRHRDGVSRGAHRHFARRRHPRRECGDERDAAPAATANGKQRDRRSPVGQTREASG